MCLFKCEKSVDDDKAYKEIMTKLNDLLEKQSSLQKCQENLQNQQNELYTKQKEFLQQEFKTLQDTLEKNQVALQKHQNASQKNYEELKSRISNLENNCNLTIETDRLKTTVTYKHGLLDEILFSICIGVFIVITISCIFITKSEFYTKHLITFACIFVSLAALCIALLFCRRSEQKCMQKNITNLLVMSEYEATVTKLSEQRNRVIVLQNNQLTENNTVHFDNENTVVELFRAYTNAIQRD